MNLPFKFAAASANAILDLTDEAANLILAGILGSSLTDAQKQRFGLLGRPYGPCWLTGVSVQADKDATIIFGAYDKTAAAFYGVLPVTLLAAGGSAFDSQFVEPGFPLPLGGAVVPAIQVVVGTSVILTGQIETVTNQAEQNATPFNPAGTPYGLLSAITH